jgi:hypothetical protein
VGDAPYIPFVAGLWRCIGPMAPRKVSEAHESYGTRWSRSPEKLSHLPEVRPTFRDASCRSESALGRVADEIEDVVDAVLAEAGRREQKGRQRGVKCKREMECRGSPPRTSTRPYLESTPSTQQSQHQLLVNATPVVFGLVLIVEERFIRLRNECIDPKSTVNCLGAYISVKVRCSSQASPFGLTHLPGHPATELSIARFSQRAKVQELRPSMSRNRTVTISLP